MAYSRHNWQTREPITEAKMNNLESGIVEAKSSASDALSAASGVQTQINTISNDVSAAQSTANQAVLAAQAAAARVIDGENAWKYVEPAMTKNESTGTYSRDIKGRFEADERNITTALSSANDAKNWIQAAYQVNTVRINGIEQTATSLAEKINDMDRRTSEAAATAGGASTIVSGVNAAGLTMMQRLQNLDKNQDLSNNRSVPEIYTEIYNARNGKANLNKRITDDETLLSQHTTAINNRVQYDDVKNDLTSTDTNKPLSAAKGTQLAQTIGGSYSPSNTVADGITTAENNAKQYTDGKLGTGFTTTDTVRKAITNLTSADSGLSGRIDSINTAIGTNTTADTIKGRIQTLENTVGNSTTGLAATKAIADEALSTANAAAVATTVNSAIEGINTKINTIAGELGMLDGSAIHDTNTKIDTLESHVTMLANELGMVSNGEIQDVTSRVDTLETTINHQTTGLAATYQIATDTQTAINNATTGLAATYNIATAARTKANAAATADDLTALAGRVSSLESNPVSSTLVVENVTYNSDGKPTNISNPSSDVDYLLKKDDQYYYWKYINNNWKLISGAGGGGSSSAEFYTTLAAVPTPPSDTVDYFIGSGNNYIHYRWYNNGWKEILPAHLINDVSVDRTSIDDKIHKSRPIIKEIGSNTNLLAGFDAIQSFNAVQVDDGYKLTWVNIDGEANDITITGGGGGSSSGVNVSIDRVTDAIINTIVGETCLIQYNYTVTEGPNNEPYITTGTGTWSINNIRVATQEVHNGLNTFDITSHLRNGTNNITLSVVAPINGEMVNRTKTWSINVTNFSLEWDYNESTVNSGSVINFYCTPYGTELTKTLHLKVGTHEQTQIVTTSGILTTVTLVNNYTHGNYTAEMWMTATINDEPEPRETPHIIHDFIVVEQGNNTPIIAASLPSTTMNQYDTITIPFVVYTPNSSLSTVTLAVDGVVQDIREDVNRLSQTWYYTPSTLGTNIIYDESDPPQPISGTHTLTITSGSTTKTLTLTVKRVQINNSEIEGYDFKLKASELPSNNALLTWNYGNYTATQIANARAAANPSTAQRLMLDTALKFSNNFDWINGGIKTEYDENKQLRQYIRIKAGTTMTIPYKMFEIDPKRNGSNFKIIFKVENCRNYDAIITTTIANNSGIQLNAHNAIFKSTTTSISTQYGENDYTELEFEVYKNHVGDTMVEAVNPYMMAWIDGVITTARAYDGNFTQANPADIVIGSNDCDVCIYLIKYYPKVLEITEHLANFIADAPNASEMIKRFNRNDILEDEGTEISPDKLAQKNRDCRVWLYDISRMTTGKKDYVRKVNFQQIYKNGTAYEDGLHGIGTLTVQGTSSVNYRKGAANTDINFYDTDAEPGADETFDDYSALFDGQNNDLLYDIVNGEKVLKPISERGYKINPTSTPITYSNMKVNFASCEQVNNMCNAEWYQQFQPYPSLSTRDCMEFAMGVQFIRDHGINEPSGEVILFNEKGNKRDPNAYYMYSIGNLGTSKKNTHIFHSNNECCIEIMNNQNAGCRMVSVPADLEADYTAYQNENYEAMTNYDWGGKNKAKDHSYEMRFPDTKNPVKEIKAGWARFVKWMAENNPAAATDATIPAETYTPYTFKGHKRQGTQVLQGTTVNQYAGTYTTDSFERRMAKMLSECEDYIAMDSIIYHFLFIERHTMVDNVAKNTFWSAAKTNQYINGVEQENTEGYWIWDLSKNYDNDTSDGNNNEGQLIFDYGNEANDKQDGKDIFNASDAVWFVFASNLYEACATMFQNRESATSKNGKWSNAWNATAYHNYLLSEQRKVPERVWNECYWYDYLRTFETGKVYDEETDKDTQIIDKSWITFLDGGQKIHQRKHYETFEELYNASKYRSNFSTANSITLRGYTPDAGDPSLLAVPAKSEITVKMYNKCYVTAHFDNNLETEKAERGQLVTLKFLEANGNYMRMSDTVIKIDTASMIQEISDLAPLYPGQASFSAASRLRSIKIGDSTVGYNNPHITNTETGTVDFGANYMLEHLEVQNLSNANQPLNLSGCPALAYLDASGSSFTSIVFANGGLLSEAYINNPTNLTMRNLDLLTLNNFHITDPTAVTQLRLEGCKLFDKLTFIESLTNINVLRLSGITWTLDNNILLNKLLGIMGMDELGYTVAQSYLAGTITLTGTVYGGDHSEYLKAWSPDLTIDVSHATYIAQHLVTYCDENGVELYTKYTNHNTPLIDIVATEEYPAPTKPADIESQYIFGRLSAGDYLEYSGWRAADASQSFYPEGAAGPSIPTITGPISVYAVYTAIKQQYVVRWLVDNKEVKQTTPQNHGGGYNLSAPTIKEVQAAGATTCSFTDNGNGTCRYRIMTGWDKLPTNIQPTVANAPYDIHATWLERTNINYTAALADNNYSIEEKLFILKNIASTRSNLAIQDSFPITLGYDGLKPGITILGAPKRYTKTSDMQTTDYMLFDTNKDFTIAIDYKFDYIANSSASEAVLFSCYDDSNGSTQGFKLFYNPSAVSPVPQISFGDTSQPQNIDERVQPVGSNMTDRYMLVIRHTAGTQSNLLYIYSGSNSTGLVNEYDGNLFRKTLKWSSAVSDAKIKLGGVSSTSTSTINAQGTIYSVRYWDEDLGEGECVQLANWCHETMNFALQDYSEHDIHSAILNASPIKLVLHTLNASQMGTIIDAAIDKTTEATVGWDPSTIRTFYNSRIFQALPIKLQSIMSPVSIVHKKAFNSDGGYMIGTGDTSTPEYVFAPSYYETSQENDSFRNSYASEAAGSFGWSGITIKQYSNGTFINYTGANSFINLRFPYRNITINNTTTIYLDYPSSNAGLESEISNYGLTLKPGDILIPQNSTVAYIYVSQADTNMGAPRILKTSATPACLDTGSGAWIPSTSWWTRSVSLNAVNGTGIQPKHSRFTSIDALGAAQSGTQRTNGIVYSIAL